MDFVIELLIQVFVQIVLEFIGDLLLDTAFRGVTNVLQSRIGRFTVGGLAGFGFGVAWGNHLSGNSSWPRLLWVSLALATTGLLLAVGRVGVTQASTAGSAWRQTLVPPWRWPADRLVGFAILNLAIATGIGVAFNH